MNRSSHLARIACLVTLSLFASCHGRRPQQPSNDAKQACAEKMFFDEAVPYCVRGSGSREVADVQVLVDGSGSMVGFDPKLPEIIRWSQHAISAIQNSSITIQKSRICSFREKQGITACAGITGAAPPIASHGNTNLHEAIDSAKDYALTIIVTDGVAATGDQGRGACATGVDAACVARSLVNAIHSNDTNDDHGVWIIPLIAPYEGQFFTEESIPLSSFNSQAAIEKVRSDIQTDCVIQNPKTDDGGKLVYNYKGPRGLLLIVIAKKGDIGRSAIQALWDRAEYLNIKQVGTLQNYSGGVAALRPIEIYPGYLNKVRWQSLTDSDQPEISQGTIDVKANIQADKTSLQVNCPAASENKGTFTLTGTDKPAEVAGCVPIRMLPAFSFKLRPTRNEDEPDFSQFLTGFKLPSCSDSTLDLHLECSTQTTRRCSEKPIPVQWVAFMHYGEAADSLKSSTSATAKTINDFSTAHPSTEPHKVTALSLILELFYRQVVSDARSTVLNSFEICKQ